MDRSRPAFVDAVVIELGLPGSALASGISTELASLHEAELVHIIDLAVIDGQIRSSPCSTPTAVVS